ncbi:MAG: outer membrane protein assembly factor BamE, partial [Sphingobium sp.]
MRFKTLSLIAVLAGVAATLPGCTRIRTHQGYLVDNLLVDSIQPGIDNRQSVEGTLGRPTFVSQFGEKDWYYVARDMKQLAFANPSAKAQTILRVRFDAAGNVVGVDKRGLEQVADISPKDGKTQTLGRKRGI